MITLGSRQKVLAILGPSMAVLALVVAGCGDDYTLAPVEGKVLYRGKPLPFGSITFRPQVGPSARGNIESDGAFRLRTEGLGEGAILGKHRVRISCFENQNPNITLDPASDPGPGRPLIPKKYTFVETSGLEAEVSEENEPLVFELTD